MKLIKIFMLISLSILCVFALLFVVNPDRKIEWNEFKSKFKSTVFLNLQINIHNIEKVEIMGVALQGDTGQNIYTFTDKNDIQRIIDYLNEIKLVEANYDEYSMSANANIKFYDASENVQGDIQIYGQVFIEDRKSEKFYRSRNDWIIKGLESIEFN